MKLAVAPLHHLGLVLVVPAAAAHQLAAVHALRRLVAEASHSSERARALVAHAVVRALVDVDEVIVGGRVELVVDLDQLAPGVELHGGGTVVLLLQRVAHLAEVRQLKPAGLQATGPGDTMTLAGDMSQVRNRPPPRFIVVQIHQ